MVGPYTLAKGRIQNSDCEINVAEHCNLACRSCSHLSPMMHRSFVDPEEVFRDLSTLAASYKVHQVKLLGGEALLHPYLSDVIQAVLLSGIADGICVVTNGVLLPRMPETFWNSVNHVWVSSYPGFELSPQEVERCQQLAKQHGVQLDIYPDTTFRESHASLGSSDEFLVKRIYSTCRVAHEWRCHTIAHGYFFKCPQSYFIPKGLGPASGLTIEADGLRISSDPSFKWDLLSYLQSPVPLASCHRCLGTAGKRFPHKQISRRSWSALQHHTIEDLLDVALLSKEDSHFITGSVP